MTKELLAKLGISVDEGKELTDEELVELFLGILTKKDNEIKSQKDLISKRNSEISSLKDQQRQSLSDEEQRTLHYQELEETNATLTRKLAINDRVSTYLEIGYAPDLARKIAEAEVDGKPTAEYHKAFIVAREESLRAELLKDTPRPNTNGTTNTRFTKENFKKGLISMEEMNELKETNPTLYTELIS